MNKLLKVLGLVTVKEMNKQMKAVTFELQQEQVKLVNQELKG